MPRGGKGSLSKPAWDSEPAAGQGLFDQAGYSPGEALIAS